jgi:hypothetical protein
VVWTLNELQMPPCQCPPPHAARFDSHNKGHPLSQQQSRSQRMIPCKFAPKKDVVFSPQFITVCSYCTYLSGRRGWWRWPSAILIYRAHNLARLELVKRDLCLSFSLLIFFAQPRYSPGILERVLPVPEKANRHVKL